jgi:enoyl-CoA hydratase/carnithine racemase
MDACRLEPWMLRADWRVDDRPFLVVDLSDWPVGASIHPRPPVPVIAIGDSAHPAAADADVRLAAGAPLAALFGRIANQPHAAAALVDLLRATEDLPVERALVCESLAFGALQASEAHRRWLAARPEPSPSPPGRVHIERRGETLGIVIDRPAARNAIDTGLRDALFDAFTLAGLDETIRAMTLRATGRSFGIGADLAEFGLSADPALAHAIRKRTLPALALSPRRSICHVHVQGACIGASLELAAFAGRVTASADAWFQLPELAMGVLPGAGGCVSIPRRIGRQRTAWMVLSGQRIGARTALEWGLVDAIVDDLAVDQGRPYKLGV